MVAASIGEVEPRHPPLACRPSPPQGGRSAVLAMPPFLQRLRLVKAFATSDLPLEGEMPGRAEGDGKERHRLRDYLPFHTGSRFSANARNPSILSSDP
ncbi:hypothetical protein EJ073_17910 [Mesorhizobium sp. M4B.F.Ca.ET.058.02.1.1]|nr:hypothetical protein EJ073_17910 [Mesorhizobium sp. M4B.F.Ca.ET.058.02.1.1]